MFVPAIQCNAGPACHALERALRGGCAVRFVLIVAAPACLPLPHNTMPCHTVPYRTTPYHTMRNHKHHTIPYHAEPHRPVYGFETMIQLGARVLLYTINVFNLYHDHHYRRHHLLLSTKSNADFSEVTESTTNISCHSHVPQEIYNHHHHCTIAQWHSRSVLKYKI